MTDAPKRIEDIVSELADAKEQKLVQFYIDHKKNKMEAIDPEEAYKAELAEVKLKTGTLMDEMVGGGFEAGSSVLLFGEYGAGKTETCFTIAVLCPDVVIYIDTEGSFKWSRIKEICDKRGLDYKAVFKKIKLFKPANWIEQMMLLSNLPSPADVGKIGLIIVDSLTKEFRGIEFAGRQELSIKQPMIREYPITLTEIAKAYECAIIITTQIYEKPQATNPFLPDWTNQEAVGGMGLMHQTSYVMFLRKAQGNVRIARLTDADWKPLSERPYLITEKGIEDIPDTEKAKLILEKAEKYEQTILDATKDKEKKVKKKGDQEPEQPPQQTENKEPATGPDN